MARIALLTSVLYGLVFVPLAFAGPSPNVIDAVEKRSLLRRADGSVVAGTPKCAACSVCTNGGCTGCTNCSF
ncbi:hypothetical protein PHLGIDRAFT_118341 [Phlebiopsis gigantea 11061_1 CR5-6]|uniref:Uncharacterized protein n=1 Tax=Phlebiopsis gigantea (strain 11061_1 CR5-6) TaxID=745531 RepID=A0A0C3S872_PHLG1|nr:hypothetical protein PHLGIDRAFT_118341 [Phlebiopsis gigantea 11061_1 CR5-6]